jgi:taurine dioxygenase
MEIRKQTPTLGAEILGIDVRRIDADQFAKIYQAWLDHIVLVIRGQDLTIPDYLRYSSRFGRIKPHLVRRSRHPEFPELMLMDNRIGDNRVSEQTISTETLRTRGGQWHTDLSYEDVAAKATQLYSRAVPSSGGDTLFTSTYASYDALPERLRQRIASLSATYKYGGRGRRQIELLEPADRERKPAQHPLVKVHPETRRPVLYFNAAQILGIVGLEAQESDDLIAELTTYMVQPGHEYRHRWQVGDVVIWDNRCALHRATGDYPPGEHRSMWRVTIMEQDWQEQRLSA